MGKVVFSKDYGYRKVIRVVTNPSDPKWLHEDGSTPAAAHTGDTVKAGLQPNATELLPQHGNRQGRRDGGNRAASDHLYVTDEHPSG
jgi:hypothetical protein